jgi:hypothetical protein
VHWRQVAGYTPGYMRRCLRRLRRALPVASLALCITATTLWIASYWFAQMIGHRRSTVLQADSLGADVTSTSHSVSMVRGIVRCYGGTISTRHVPGEDSEPERVGTTHTLSASSDSFEKPVTEDQTWLGFRFERRPGHGWDLWFPAWVVVLVTAVPPALSAPRWYAVFTRRPASHCQGCGYDMRATPDRCPECGRAPRHATIQ